jgi:hypothetical protein
MSQATGDDELNRCTEAEARAALEAADKAPELAKDPDLRLAIYDAVFESCDGDEESAASCTSDVLRAVDAYLRGGRK